MHPTLRTVADAAGVSIQTVSNILNAPHKVQRDTRDRVKAEILRQGYRPNRSARSLRQRRSGLLGFCVPRVGAGGSGVDDQFVHAVTGAAERAGYHVLLFTEEGEPAMGAYDALLGQRAVDGFILSSTTADDPRHEWLVGRRVPFASFGRRWADPEIGSWVDIDGAAGVALAVDHLAMRGHHRVAFIGWPAGSGVGDDRLSGFERSATANGMTVTDIERGENSHDTGARLARRLLDQPERPTAIVCVSDTMAVGCDSALRSAGMIPGHDVAITGFDDSVVASVPAVSLTTVRQPLPLAGDHVVRLLVAQLVEPAATIERVLLEPTLVVRASTSSTATPITSHLSDERKRQ